MVFSADETAEGYELHHSALKELSMHISEGHNARVIHALRFSALRTADIDFGLRPLASVETLTLQCAADVRLLPGLATHKHLRRLVLRGYGEYAERFIEAHSDAAVCPFLTELGIAWRIPNESLRVAILLLCA